MNISVSKVSISTRVLMCCFVIYGFDKGFFVEILDWFFFLLRADLIIYLCRLFYVPFISFCLFCGPEPLLLLSCPDNKQLKLYLFSVLGSLGFTLNQQDRTKTKYTLTWENISHRPPTGKYHRMHMRMLKHPSGMPICNKLRRDRKLKRGEIANIWHDEAQTVSNTMG